MKPHESGLTCNHAEVGLCRQCQADYAIDSGAWIEFGAHPAGDANSEQLFRDMAAEAAAERQLHEKLMAAEDDMPPDVWEEIPF